MGIAEARCVSIYIIRNARIENVGKSQSCMVSKLRMICKQGGQDNTCLDVERSSFTWMGYTMRTERYRYTEYVVWNGTTLSPIWEQLKATELYDHAGDDGPWTDPDRFENVNLAKTAAPALVKQLSVQLHAAFGYPDQTDRL